MSLIPVSYRAYRVWQRDRDVFLRLWLTEIGPIFLEPLITLAAFGLGLGTYVILGGGLSYIQFIAPGIIASYIMFSPSFECTYASFVRMEIQKTFDAIIATPVNIEDVIAGEIFWGATRSVITSVAITLVVLAFGLVSSPLVVFVPVVAIVAGLMFASIAMLYTAVVPSINSFNYFFTLFVTPMFLVSGTFFPLDGLPEIVQQIAWFIPLTHVVNILRALTTGQLTGELIIDFLWIIVVTIIFFILSIRMMQRRLIR